MKPVDDKWGAGSSDKWETLKFPDGTPQKIIAGPGNGYRIFRGEHPHGRSDNSYYVKIHNEPVAFSGHRICLGYHILERNYLKSSSVSGSEIRKGCDLLIEMNGRRVYGKFFRESRDALIWAAAHVHELTEHPVQLCWGEKGEFPDLIGRMVSYNDEPGVVTMYFPDQGSMIIDYDGDGKGFTPLLSIDPLANVKVDLLSERIYWFRGLR